MSKERTDSYGKEEETKKWYSEQGKQTIQNLLITAAFIILSFSVYSNTLQSAWHLDDYPNIVNNTKLHIQNLDLASITQTFHSHPSFDNNALYRPIVCLSFAFNWLFGGENVFGFHLVNITIHALTGFMLYLGIYALLSTPNIKKKYTIHIQSIAIISACFWMLHPIQTQAVTYIVQRMALFSGLFYVTAFCCYIKARLAVNTSKKIILFCLTMLSFMGGILSKENVVVFPILVIIVEYIFFLDHASREAKKTFFITSGIIAVISCNAAIVVYSMQPYRIEHLYSQRSFTLTERILSENRILLFYLSQIFAPTINKFSLFHNFILSKNFFYPATTFVSILFNIFLIGFGILRANRNPLLAFSILSYFCGHIVESTFLPLELIFEHRNYIPSMFLPVPFVAFAYRFSDNKVKSNILKKTLIQIAAASLLIILGTITYQRNKVWKDTETLWTDVYKKAPNNARAYQNIAMIFQQKGQYDVAIALYNDSLHKDDPSPTYSRYLVFNNLGMIYANNGNYKTAISYYQKAAKEKPKETKNLYNASLLYIKMGDYHIAGDIIDRVLSMDPENYHFLNTRGFIWLKQHNYTQALLMFRKSLLQRPFDRNAMLNMISTLNGLGAYERASWFLQIARKQNPGDILFILASIENNLLAKHHDNVATYINKLVTTYSKETIKNEIITSAAGGNTSPFNLSMLKKAIIRAHPDYFK